MGSGASNAGTVRQQERISFSFGRNWLGFVEQHLTPQREAIAEDSLKVFLEREDLRGLSFLDLGCGSGLFSLAAYRLGARPVVSVDVDPFSVISCRRLREREGNPEGWQVVEGSVLDAALMERLAPADIVYAWGSLHHTGQMWQAMRLAAGRVKPGGLFFTSIYNHVTGRGSSEYWLKVKRLYNRSSAPVKRLLECAHVLRYTILPQLIRLRSPLRPFREYARNRGMSYWVDVRDWLGGYPYEFARPEEVFRFCARQCAMELVNLRTTSTTGTNEFLFRRNARPAGPEKVTVAQDAREDRAR